MWSFTIEDMGKLRHTNRETSCDAGSELLASLWEGLVWMERTMAGCYDQMGGVKEITWRKGPWTTEEDSLLTEYVKLHGEGRWNSVSYISGLRRNGKSCRLRWVNYLRPDLKKGQITPDEESLIVQLHAKWGNRWSTIARSLPGRTDNEIKNYWRTHFKKSGKPSKAAAKAKSIRAQMREQRNVPLQQQDAAAHELQKMLHPIKVDQEGEYRVVAPPETNLEVVLVNQIGMEMNCLSPIYNEEGPSWDASMEEEMLLWNGLWDLGDHVNIWANGQDASKIR